MSGEDTDEKTGKALEAGLALALFETRLSSELALALTVPGSGSDPSWRTLTMDGLIRP